MRRIAIAGLFVFISSVSGVYADAVVDFGGAVSNRSRVELADDTALFQSNGLSLWFTAKGEASGFSARAGYTFVYDGKVEPEISHLPDVQTLNLYGNFPVSVLGLSRFRYDLGRFNFRDHSGYIINQNLDGIRFGFFYPVMSVQASVGTSLLPNKNSAPVVMSKSDAADIADRDIFMGSPRAIGLLEVSFADLLRQELTLSVGFQEDLRHIFPKRSGELIEEGEETILPAAGGLVDTQYVGIGVRGNIAGGLFYNSFFTLSTGRTLSYLTEAGAVSGNYEYTPILAGAAGLGLNLYLPQAMSSAAGLQLTLSTGDAWEARSSYYEGSTVDSPSLFIPITATPLTFVLAPTLGNVIVVKGSYSLKPLAFMEDSALADKLQTAITLGLISRYKNGPVSISVPNTDSQKNFLGTEAGLAVSFRPFSDLGVSLSGGVFIPNTSDGGPYDAPGASATVTKIELSASFSF